MLSVDTVRAEMPRRGKRTTVAATAEPTEDADSELETLRRERDAARDAQKQLKKQLKAAEEQLELSNQELTEATAELSEALEQVETLKGEGHDCHSESGDRHVHERDDLISQLEELQAQHDEVRDLVDCKQWEIDKINECGVESAESQGRCEGSYRECMRTSLRLRMSL